MASMTDKDYYAILEVDEGASTDEIRRAFQQKARKLHPDVNKEPDAEERFKEVSEAYAVLSDEGKRKRYNAMRSGAPFAGAGSSAAGYGYGGSPFDGGFPFGTTQSWSWSSERNSRSYRPRAGADITYVLDLDGESAAKGVRRGITYQRYATCEACAGMGSVEHVEPTTCPTCGGAGRIRVDLASIFGVGYFDVTCPECEGTGQIVADPCVSCGGSGRVLTATELVLEVPAHAHDGDVVRAKGKGNAGTNGRESGDFVCEIHVAEERLSREQEGGIRLAGVGIPMLLLGLIGAQRSGVTAIIGAVMVAVGLAITIRGGVHPNTRWLRSAGAALVGGAVSGIVITLLLSFLISGIFAYPVSFLILLILFFILSVRRPR